MPTESIWAPTAEVTPPRTIAWSVGHLGWGCFTRADYLVGEHKMSEDGDWPMAADEGLKFLADGLNSWRSGLDQMTDEDLDTVGRSAYPGGLDPTLPLLDMVGQPGAARAMPRRSGTCATRSRHALVPGRWRLSRPTRQPAKEAGARWLISRPTRRMARETRGIPWLLGELSRPTRFRPRCDRPTVQMTQELEFLPSVGEGSRRLMDCLECGQDHSWAIEDAFLD